VAKTILRRSLLVALASFIGLAPMGVGQVPGGPTGPALYLTSAEDLGALKFVLECVAPTYGDPVLDSIELRVAYMAGSQTLYKGRLEAGKSTLRSSSSRLLELYLVHRQGGVFSIPPDQLLVLPGAGQQSSLASATASDPSEVAFLVEALAMLSQPGQPGPLQLLARWFDSSSTLVLTEIAVGTSGADYRCKLRFVDQFAPGSGSSTRVISASMNRGAFSGWTVQ
jgi:hypothetical protein